MELSSGQNPQCYTDSAISYSGMIRKTERFSNKRTLFEECRTILQRSHENRIPAENQTLLQLVEKSDVLRELSDLYGQDFIKGLLRNAKIQLVQEGQVIAQQQQDIRCMVIILQGKLALQRPTSDAFSDQPQQQVIEELTLKTQALFQRLTVLAKKEREVQRRTMKLKRKNTLPISDYRFLLPVLSKHDYEMAQNNIQRTILANEQLGGKQRLIGKFFKNRVISVQKSALLVIEISFLFYWLEVAFRGKLAKNIERMKTIPAFEILDSDKLAEIILSMRLIRKSKHSFVYSQGDPADSLYLLTEGQLRITKQADLFRQNPNNLYIDRRKLVAQGERAKGQQGQVLPFANLTALYNYRPIKKSIEMGILSSFGLFGEEELIFRTNRETTVQVSSIEAAYYQIEFKKVLEIIGPKNIDKFKQVLEASLSKKILYRQKEFADQVLLQNQNNLNYFYIDEGKSEPSPRKIKLEKINKRVESRTASKQHSTEGTPAFYTTFNFYKMLSRRYSTIDSNIPNQTTDESQSQLPPFEDVVYSGAEEKVVDMSHTWDPIQRKVRQEGRLSRRLSPFTHNINIEQPLIDKQFFDKVAKEQRRINKQQRNLRFSLGKRRE